MATKGIQIQKGADLVLQGELFSDDAETVPIDLTGASLAVVESTFPSGGDPTLSIEDAPNGVFSITFTDAQTAAFVSKRNYRFQIALTDSGGLITHHPTKPDNEPFVTFYVR